MNENQKEPLSIEEKLAYTETIFVKYGAVAVPEINEKSRKAFGLRLYYDLCGTYYRAEVSTIDGSEVILINATSNPEEVGVGIDETIAAFPADIEVGKLEREVLKALSVH